MLRIRRTDINTAITAATESPCVVVAAISFESRATHMAQVLRARSIVPWGTCFFDYDTTTEPEASDLREFHRSMLSNLWRESEDLGEGRLPPYATTNLRADIRRLLELAKGSVILFDISCLTRVHLLALASVLADFDLANRVVFLGYTSPDSYGLASEDRPGWRDTILVPIGNPSPFRREGHARGVVLAGHDAERLTLALGELEPSSGVFVYAFTDSRPDLMRRAKEVNKPLAERMLSLRMPRWKDSPFGVEGWKEAIVDLEKLDDMDLLLDEAIRRAREDEGPMVLFPFGPKPISLSSGLIIAQAEAISGWAVYPIPERYIVEYSRGASRLYWFEVARS